MKKITLALLLMLCVSSVVVAQVGRYQLASGKVFQIFQDLQKDKIERSYPDGLFRINTETGLVEEYTVDIINDKDGNVTIKTGWKALENTKGVISKNGEMLK